VLDVKTSYRKMKSPAFVGQLRMKSWRPLLHIADSSLRVDADLDDVERKRVAEYWARQREVYGFEFGEVMVQIDFDKIGPIVTSSVRVTKVLPGDRVDMGSA
jgi:hypothetical protein